MRHVSLAQLMTISGDLIHQSCHYPSLHLSVLLVGYMSAHYTLHRECRMDSIRVQWL